MIFMTNKITKSFVIMLVVTTKMLKGFKIVLSTKFSVSLLETNNYQSSTCCIYMF